MNFVLGGGVSCTKEKERKTQRKNVSVCGKNEHLRECVCLLCSLSMCIKKNSLLSVSRLLSLSLSLSLIFLPTYLLLRVACDGFLVVVFCVGVLVFVFVVLVFDALSSSQIHYKAFFTAATVSASNALISDNMASTLAALASCMTAETILSPLEST